ncbi:MAG: MBL fold metallo-hydrolase [Phascolarctobacterium sp.]|nr:MBL fold metallo-hydrolase [Phascolarctobacterium sp.]
MKIYALMENISHDECLACEHGLSLYIEADGKKILFDTGASEKFADNAEKMGVDLKAVDFAAISHGHYDHGGGLKKFIEINDHAPIYISDKGFNQYYSGTDFNVSIPEGLAGNERFVLTSEPLKLSENITLLNCNDREAKYYADPYGLNKVVDGEFIPDDFLHEQYLIIEENGKRIVISGCSHKGILNIMEWLKPDILIGGFHFFRLTTEGEDAATLDKSAKILNEYGATYYTCHCTGTEQYDYLKAQMPKLNYIATGDVIEF